MKLLTIILMAMVLPASAQKNTQYFPVEIYPNSAKINTAAMLFDEMYIIGYNKKGQLLYAYTETTEAADHNGYRIILYDVPKKKSMVLKSYAMEDSTNIYSDFKSFFKAHQKTINSYTKKYALENKLPTITPIDKKAYTLIRNCKKEYEWFNCTYRAIYKEKTSFTIKSDGQPSIDTKPILYKLLSFDGFSVIIYNTTKRGWEGTPFVVNFNLY